MVDYGVIRPGSDQEFPRGDEIKRENTVEKEGEGKLEAVIWFLEHDGILIANREGIMVNCPRWFIVLLR